MGKAKDCTGLIFGKLTVIQLDISESNCSGRRWICKCECGNINSVSQANLRRGNTKSCGCARKTSLVTHGQSRDRKISTEYNTWANMKLRCYYPKDSHYKRYGGRGITVCDEWRDSYESFFRDMGKRPSPTHSIDRIDNNGNYCKENCRWATLREQSRNKKVNVWLEYNGERMVLKDWAIRLKIGHGSIKYKLKKGFTLEDIIEYYKIHGYKSSIKLTAEQVIEIKKKLKQGVFQKDIAKEYNVSPVTITHINLNKNWKRIVI